MALLRCEFYSSVLEMSTTMTVIVPENVVSRLEPPAPRTGRHPTLFLLHGLSDDDSSFVRGSSIERYASAAGLAVVMPQAHRSFYSDEVHGRDYWTFLSEELPDVASRLFPLSTRREDCFVAGVSMGGYGAMKWALRCPERFAAAASLSGALGLAARMRLDRGDGLLDPRLWHTIFDDRPIEDGPDDVVWLLGQRAEQHPDRLPELWMCCGTEDALFDENRTFKQVADSEGVAIECRFAPGAHTWEYWDRELQALIEWLPIATDRSDSSEQVRPTGD